ncbi:MAG: HNH endonuclease signature motif containing protein [Isosphaeraceae bacterium]
MYPPIAPGAASPPSTARPTPSRGRSSTSAQEWGKVHRLQLAREPFCEPCKKLDRLTPATAVHHKLPIEQRPDLALFLPNLESICRPCHSAKHSTGRARG